MFFLNHIAGIGAFSIMDNLRLIVIAVIFIGIIVVLLYLKSAKNGRKTERKYMQATNPNDSGSKEEIKAKEGEDFEDTSESEVEIEEKSVINLEKIEANIKNTEAEITTKFTAEIENIRAEFTAKIEELISIIEERKEEGLEALPEVKEEVRLGEKEPIASSQKTEQEVSEKAVGDSADFDMQEFLNEVPIDVSSSDESKTATEENVVPEKRKEEELEVLSEDKAEVELESKEPIASSDEKAEDVLRVNEGDSADFDIQEFLEEVENLPSEKEPDSEK